MAELSIEYMNELAKQIIFISAFLGGFSATLLGTLILSKRASRVLKLMIVGTSLSAISFILSVFAMTQLMMITLPGYPFNLRISDTLFPRVGGTLSFFIGILSLLFVIAISGWMHSKKLGIFTTCIGVITIVLVFCFIS